ncbi:unnamed protein product [Rhizoctonia solani]|uniref:Uncharacterized protein n=1 Tax=Rhizoctonia solani TaxID=456999 RepID=A0A8H3DUM2_9AGAM|nr:unnamed protein product [Rhizoctonia solani]
MGSLESTAIRLGNNRIDTFHPTHRVTTPTNDNFDTNNSTLRQLNNRQTQTMAPELEPRQIVTQTAQALPSWLSYSALPGTGQVTSYTILRFPLTYYGPSIPLGTEGVWTYGGLTPPPTSATPSATSTITTSPTTSLPTSSLTSSATRPTTTTFASVSISTRTRTSSAAPTSTSTSPAGARGSLPVVAIILIALGVAAALLLCCLAGALFWRRRKSRRREPPRGDSEFYAGPGPDDDIESLHPPNVLGTGERHSLLGGDSFIVVGNRDGNGVSPHMSQRSLGGASYQRLAESRVSQVSRRTGSDEIGVAYTDMPPPRSRRRTVTAVSGGVSSSPSHPTSSSQPGIGSMRTHNGSQRSSLFQHPAEQDESPVLPRDSGHGAVKRASDLGEKPLQAPAPAAQGSTTGATLGAELGMLGLGTRYPDPSQSLLATSSSGGSGARFPPRLVTPVASSFGSGSRVSRFGGDSRPPSQFVAAVGSQAASRASRGHSPEPEPSPRASPPLRDTLAWPDSPESEHDEGAQLLTAERGNVRSGIGLLGRFSWFTRGGNGNGSPAPRASRNSYPGWMSPPTEEGFLAEVDAEQERDYHASPSDPPTLESRPPPSHPGMVRLVPRERNDSSLPRPISSTSGNTVYHDAPSQPGTPRDRSGPSTWLGFLGRGSPAGPAPPVPQRPLHLSHHPSLIPVAPPPPQQARTRAESDLGPAPRIRVESSAGRRISVRPESDILDRPAPESLLDLPPPTLVPPSPAPVFPPGLARLPRTYNFGLLNELGDEPPAAEEQWQHIRSSPEHVDWRRVSMGRAVRINSPHVATPSQTGSVHGGGASPTVTDPTSLHVPRATGSNSSRSHSGGSDNSESRRAVGQAPSMSAMTGGTTYSVSTSGTGTPADTTTVSSHPPPETLVTESFEFGGYGFGYHDSEYDEYETRATTVSSNDSSGRRAVDLHGEEEDEADGQDVYVGRFGQEGGPRFLPPMSAVGLPGWGQPRDDGNSGRT